MTLWVELMRVWVELMTVWLVSHMMFGASLIVEASHYKHISHSGLLLRRATHNNPITYLYNVHICHR